MRTLLTALTALMLFATPVVAGDLAGDLADAMAADSAGDHQKAFRLYKRTAGQGSAGARSITSV